MKQFSPETDRTGKGADDRADGQCDHPHGGQPGAGQGEHRNELRRVPTLVATQWEPCDEFPTVIFE